MRLAVCFQKKPNELVPAHPVSGLKGWRTEPGNSNLFVRKEIKMYLLKIESMKKVNCTMKCNKAKLFNAVKHLSLHTML